MSDISDLFANSILQAQVCEQCEEGNPIGSAECQACGSPFPVKREPRRLSFLHQSGLEEQLRTPLEDSTNLRMLRECVDGVRGGELPLEDYLDAVGEVLDTANNGLDLLNAPLVQQALPHLEAESQQLVRRSIAALDAYRRACERMMDYDGSSLTPALEGLAMAEEALEAVDEAEAEAAAELEELEE